MPIPLTIKMETSELAALGFKKKQINDLTRGAYIAMGELWHKKFRPLHFTEAAKRRYGYAPRQGEGRKKATRRSGETQAQFEARVKRAYTDRKEAKYGHRLALVKTGESRRLTELLNVVATKNGVRVKMAANKYNFKVSGKSGESKSMRDEVTKVIPSELRAMINAGDDYIQEQLKAMNKRKFRVRTFKGA